MLKFRSLLKARPPTITPNFLHSLPKYKSFANINDRKPDSKDDYEVFVIGDNMSPLPMEDKPQDKKLPFYLLFPIKNPLFPQSSYFTKLSTAQQELLTKMKIKYVAAFLTKDAVEKDPKSSAIEVIEDDIPEEAEGAQKVGVSPAPQGRKDRFKKWKEAQQASLFNPDMSNIIIYDENLSLNYGQELVEVGENGRLEVKEDDSAFNLPKLSSINDVYQLGTLCKLNIQNIPSEGLNQKHESFAVLKALSRVEIVEEIEDSDEIKGVINKPPKPPKKEKGKQGRGFSFFRPENFLNVQQVRKLFLA